MAKPTCTITYVADRGLGHVGEADLARHPAEIHRAHAENAAVVGDRGDLAGDARDTCGLRPPEPRRGHRGLSESEAAVVGGNLMVNQCLEPRALEPLHGAFQEEKILPDAAAERDLIQPGRFAQPQARIRDHRGDAVVEARGDEIDRDAARGCPPPPRAATGAASIVVSPMSNA